MGQAYVPLVRHLSGFRFLEVLTTKVVYIVHEVKLRVLCKLLRQPKAKRNPEWCLTVVPTTGVSVSNCN